MAIFPWHQVSQQDSPFVAVFESMGLREAAGVINFVVITADLSFCNTGLFSGGRLLLGLSKVGNAPKIFSELSTAGVSAKAIVMTALLPTLGVTLNYFVPEKAFQWITAAVTLISLLWCGLPFLCDWFDGLFRDDARGFLCRAANFAGFNIVLFFGLHKKERRTL